MFKILVLEDELELNQTVCSYLNQNGYEAIGCFCANEAYDAMYGNLFDLLLRIRALLRRANLISYTNCCPTPKKHLHVPS